MHTVWVRLNAVVFFGLTVLLVSSVLAALSKIGHASAHRPIVHKLDISNLKSLKNHGGVDRALLSFDLHADMTPAFHWNIKQLFVYVVATYKTPTNPKNQIVLWDRIIEATDPLNKKILDEKNVFVKYGLVDQGAELRGTEVELSLMWDHMPLTGVLDMDGQEAGTGSTFSLPEEYQ
ncbi:hypothetical protein ACHAXT_009226 [Thalassiosira profunda]